MLIAQVIRYARCDTVERNGFVGNLVSFDDELLGQFAHRFSGAERHHSFVTCLNILATEFRRRVDAEFFVTFDPD